jgi:uncharacterized glyoxalase superfamily metalloenzyme YdcJ
MSAEHVARWELRSRFAAALSEMYGREVPAYTTLVQVAAEVNADVARRLGPDAERLGSIARVTAERHGAIRLGTPRELAQAAQVFAAMGMRPVGFYDLRDARPVPVPVVSTAFRPVEAGELARNPFRVFTSLLATPDRRFFDAGLQRRLEAYLADRRVFPAELLALARQAEQDDGLPADRARRFLALATASFAMSDEPVDGPWYRELARVSSVAADIGGVRTTHVNHLTPRVLDIDELHARMQARGIAMIDAIQGPPRWEGPDLLLRQTSFRALAEPRRFREPDGTIATVDLRVRFGEVESRGIALTAAGRALHDELTDRLAAVPPADRAVRGAELWGEHFPASESELARSGLACFTYDVVADRPRDGASPPVATEALVAGGWIAPRPIVYEDFLPQSAAGIFQSNLADDGDHAEDGRHAVLDVGWMAGAIDREIADPIALDAERQERSLGAARAALGLELPEHDPARGPGS